MNILLINGQASEVQGWGDATTTERIRKSLEATGRTVKVLDVSTMNELQRGLDEHSSDLVWSSIYQISCNTQYIGLKLDVPWVQDVLEQRCRPYVGSTAPALKVMLDKAETRRTLANAGVAVPMQFKVEPGEELPQVSSAVFVKPRYESQSAGISEESIAESQHAMGERVRYIHKNFQQCALVEEFLPGAELTVSMLGKNFSRAARYEAAINLLDPTEYEKHPVIMTDIKTGLKLELAGTLAARAEALAEEAVEALGCRDHVRVDMREDRHGALKVMEVNGIPSLNPGVSRSYSIHHLHNPTLREPECFDSLIGAIIDSALYRGVLQEAAPLSAAM
ncbi:MAG: ATP-grasp domain-containing protein [Deltaproteobacteria bacterium]|nr:ATP-grasp domain-containing protein [Deltaproteobacteria bacterium]